MFNKAYILTIAVLRDYNYELSAVDKYYWL